MKRSKVQEGDEAAFAKERERVAQLVAEGRLEGGVLRAGGLNDDVILRIWSRVIREERWSVEKAMQMAAGVGNQKGLTEVGMVLRTDNSLWRDWWVRDFPYCERDLMYTVRGLPEWIKNQKFDPDIDDPDIARQYADVPWRRLYVWFVFFTRRCAKLILAIARKRVEQWARRKRDEINNDRNAPRGIVQKIYVPEYLPMNTSTNSVKVAESALVRTSIPIASNVVNPMIEQQTVSLASLAFPRDVQLHEHNQIWLVWHLMQEVVEDETNLDLEADSGVAHTNWNLLARSWLAIAIPSGGPQTYPFFDGLFDFGNIMLSFIAHYMVDTAMPLTKEEFRRMHPDVQHYAGYEHYIADAAVRLEDRHPVPTGARKVLTTSHMKLVSMKLLENLPLAPTKRKGNGLDAPQILFVGQPATSTTTMATCIGCNSNEAVHRCKQCKVASYCGKECQLAHWIDLHQYECTGDPYLALIGGGIKGNEKEPDGPNPWMKLPNDMIFKVAMAVSDYSAFIALVQSSAEFRDRVMRLDVFRYILVRKFGIQISDTETVDVSRFAAELLVMEAQRLRNRDYILRHKSGAGTIIFRLNNRESESMLEFIFDNKSDTEPDEHRIREFILGPDGDDDDGEQWAGGEDPILGGDLVTSRGPNGWDSMSPARRHGWLVRLCQVLWTEDGYRWRLPIPESNLTGFMGDDRVLYWGDDGRIFSDEAGTIPFLRRGRDSDEESGDPSSSASSE